MRERSLYLRIEIVMGLLLLALLMPTAARAQGTSAIAGVVKDTTGAVMPGVTVADLIAPYTQFENRYSQLDLRFSKTFNVGRARVQAMMDIYNALNGAGVLAIDPRFGPTYLLPTNIMAARLFKFGGQVNF